MVKTVCQIPIKEASERVSKKNFRKVAGKRLYQHLFDKLKGSNIFDRIIVDTDNYKLIDEAKKKGFDTLHRPSYLTQSWVHGNDLIKHLLRVLSDNNQHYDYIFQLHVTAPFLKLETIQKIRDKLVTSNYDSVFTATKEIGWYWSNGKPVNYYPLNPPKESTCYIYRDTTGLYGISFNSFTKYGSRIGARPYVYEIDEIETLDFNESSDFDKVDKLFAQGKLEGYII